MGGEKLGEELEGAPGSLGEVGCVRVLQGGLYIQGVVSEGPGVGFWMASHFQFLQIKSGTLGARHGGGINEGLSSLRCREMTG